VRYITEVFDAHSGYISRMASLRGNLLKFLTSSQPAKARRLLEAEAAEEQELKELYTRFDTIFLRLYPDFIEAYNSLVREECRVNPKSASLTSELRVLALMKIGVRRSSRIAELLHYSPQTVYNYKSTLRAAMTDPAALDLWLDNPMP
jgi:DNA-binding NarL/FixJ family response regulator